MQRSPALRESSPTFPTDDRAGCSDPWDAGGTGQQTDTDPWLLGYVDMLTLMLTLLVMLLAFHQIDNRSPASPQIQNALESIPAAAHRIESKSPGFDPELRSETTSLSNSSKDQSGGPRFHASFDPATAVNPPLPPIPIQQPRPAPPSDPFFHDLFLDQTPAGLDLSIDPIDIFEFPALTLAQPQMLDPPDRRSLAMSEKPNVRAVAGQSNAARFERLISEHRLNGLIDVSESPGALRMELSERILFDTGDADLKPQGKILLDQLAQLLQNQPASIHIEGHTDNVPIATPRFPSNWELSASRASTVARYLISHAMDPARLRAIGFADTRPRAGNQTPEGRSKNRRVSLIIEMTDSKPNRVSQ